uniref:Uncharacterized protein n=1 Tax=Arundo donax TaxID=35708 RepID=A0A0A9E4G5_ARUDO
MDYGGTMPQLQENLCSLLHHAQQESRVLKPLKVMIVKDMLYLIHVKGLAQHVSPNARSQHQLAFVDLEKSCCKVFTFSDNPFSIFICCRCYQILFFITESCIGVAAFEHGRERQCAGACICPRSVFSQIPC